MNNFKHKFITQKILRAYYNVYNSLGFGFLEKVYEKALLIGLEELGLDVEPQKQINVYLNINQLEAISLTLLLKKK